MDWGVAVRDIELLSLVVSAVVGLFIGSIWYAPPVFGSYWMKLVGLKPKDMQNTKDMGQLYLAMTIASVMRTAILAALIIATNTTGAVDGAWFGLIVGVGILMTSHLTHNLFARRPTDLTLIDGVHDVLQMIAAGAIIGLWR